MRLNKFISNSGYCSRRRADELIFNGEVHVNNKLVIFPGYDVVAEDVVKVQGNILNNNTVIYLLFYKPVNVLTSYDDSRGRRCLKDFKPFDNINLAYSGRLDYKSEGLIFFTNDGDLIYRLQTPQFKIEKEYEVDVSRNLSTQELKILGNGLNTVDFKYLPCKIRALKNMKYSVTLREGKNRQIRNMFSHFGIDVYRLTRVRIGGMLIKNMKPGDVTYLAKNEIKLLKGSEQCTE